MSSSPLLQLNSDVITKALRNLGSCVMFMLSPALLYQFNKSLTKGQVVYISYFRVHKIILRYLALIVSFENFKLNKKSKEI